MPQENIERRAIATNHVPPSIPIIHLHLPRTGGTSLASMLAQHWGSAIIVSNRLEFRDLPSTEIAKASFISGHFHASQLENNLFARFRILTVLRDPLARSISEYEYSHRRAVIEADSTADDSMKYAARSSFSDWFYSDYGVDRRHHQLYFLGLNENEKRRTVPLTTLLQRAKTRLDGMLVGIFEEIDTFGMLLKKAIDLPNSTLPHRNAAKGTAGDRVNLSDAELKIMRDILAPDYALYQHARDRYERLCREYDVRAFPS